MGWVLSPPFFCAAAETAHDVAASYIAKNVGTLPPHPFEDYTLPRNLYFPTATQFSGSQAMSFLHMIESYVDDFIHMVQSTVVQILHHCRRIILHTVHSVFSPPNITGHNDHSPISLKKVT
mmetsp:Transcript_29878/g.62418  ORF Transcript_29878/g.62418 Transcript_29878/m.62418 type:complete len:121 (+) Transcript_29878:4407-4769(+)